MSSESHFTLGQADAITSYKVTRPIAIRAKIAYKLLLSLHLSRAHAEA
jgi:hypothetical protein